MASNTTDLFDSIDEASAALILQLQIEDSQQLYQICSGKGKQREGELSDTQIALNFYHQDLKRKACILSDRQMTKSIARAVQSDFVILQNIQAQEQTAANDRQTACTLGGIPASKSVPPWTITSEEMVDELLDKLSALYLRGPDFSPDSQSANENEREPETAESSAWAASRAKPRISHPQCIACQEKVPYYDIARVPCDHEYCRSCLQDLFQSSMTDDSLFPPRCCRKPIMTGAVRIFLPGELVKQYEAKKIEFETPDRTYCYNPVCSAFIPVQNITNEQATCQDCGQVTCSLCKASSHGGDCPADTALQQVLQTANANGWQRCYSCRRVVELDHGCNHITCVCRAQFCYICAAPWRTCTCPQWHEDRLLRRANQIVARQPEPVQHNPVQVRARVAREVENLRHRHNCEHERWQYVGGSHQCEECYYTLPSYIFECKQCHIRACNRCKRNRL